MKVKHWFVLLLLTAVTLAACAWTGAQGQAQDAAPLRVVTKPLEPFVIVKDGRLSGFSIELWERIAQELGVQTEWVQVATVKDQLAVVQQGTVDAAIAGISMTAEREGVIDFSHPYFNSGLRIMTSTRPDAGFTNTLRLLASPELLRIFAVGLLIMLAMAHIIWLAERNHHPAMPKAYLPGLWEATWWALGTIATAEYGGSDTRVVWRRLIAMIWVVLSIILIAQFTASVTSLLTVQQLSDTVTGPNDLPGKSVVTVANTTAARYLSQQHIRAREVETIDDAYALLDQGEAQAIVYDAPVLLYHTLTAGKGRTQVVGPLFQEEGYGIALPTGSALREPINEILLRLRQDGSYDALYQRWFGNQ